MFVLRPIAVVNVSATQVVEACKLVPPYSDEKADASPFVAALASPRIVVRSDVPQSYGAVLHNWIKKEIPNWVFTNEYSRIEAPGAACVTYTTEPFPLLPQAQYNETYSVHRSRKDFEADKKNGKIVVNPMVKISATADDTPIFNSPRVIDRTLRTCGFPTRGKPCADQYTVATGGYSTPVRRYVHPRIASSAWNAEYRYELIEVTDVTSQFKAHGVPNLDLIPYHMSAVPQIGNLVNEALDENFSGVYDILTEIGEAPETVKYLYDTLRRIILLFINIKSKESLARKKFKGKELVDEIASLWMQFRYAASPLAYSVTDALELLNTHRSFVTTRKREDQDFTWDLGNGYELKGIIEHRCFVKSAIDASSWKANLGLNPLKTLYELTPLSFVLDWVLPLGTFLGALVPPSNASQIVATYSYRVRDSQLHHDGVLVPSSVDAYKVVVIPARPKAFSFDPFLNWKRVLDSLSLGWGMFLKQHWKS